MSEKEIKQVVKRLLDGGLIEMVGEPDFKYYYDTDKGLMKKNKDRPDTESRPLQHFIMKMINEDLDYKPAEGTGKLGFDLERATNFFMEYLEFEFKLKKEMRVSATD